MIVKIPFLKKWGQKEVIALDWGFQELKFAKLAQLEEERLVLTYLDCLSVPSGEAELVKKLKMYVLEHGLLDYRVALTFQDEGLHIRRLELPRMPKEDLIEAIRWQMRDITEESLENYTIQYATLEEKIMADIVRLVILGFAIKKERVDQKLALLERVGLHPFFAEPTPVAMATTVERIYPTDQGTWIGCVDLGRHYPYFVVLGTGKLHFIRPLPGLTEHSLESEDYASKLSVELQHALDAFFLIYRTEKIDRILLAGGGAAHPQLPNLLSTNVGIPAEILNPFQKLAEVESFTLAQQKPYLFGPALAGAMLKL